MAKKKTEVDLVAEVRTLESMRPPVEIIPDDVMFIPMYRSADATGADLIANFQPNFSGLKELRLLPGHIEVIDCGFSYAVPDGWEFQLRSLTGYSEDGLNVANTVVPASGRMKVILSNNGKKIIVIKHGDKVGQVVLRPTFIATWKILSGDNK